MSGYNGSLETLFNKMENFISTKTVVGEPVNIGDVIIIPLVDVVFGVGAGSADAAKDKEENKGAGGLGAKLSPSAVLVVQNGTVQLVNVKNQNGVNKLIDMIPGVVSKFDFVFKGKDSKDSSEKKYWRIKI